MFGPCQSDSAGRGSIHADIAKPRKEHRIDIPAGIAEVRRGSSGEPLQNAPVIENLTTKSGFFARSPVTVRVKLDIEASMGDVGYLIFGHEVEESAPNKTFPVDSEPAGELAEPCLLCVAVA